MEIRLDYRTSCTVTAELQQVIVRLKLGTSALLDVAITKDGAKKLAEALMSASQ